MLAVTVSMTATASLAAMAVPVRVRLHCRRRPIWTKHGVCSGRSSFGPREVRVDGHAPFRLASPQRAQAVTCDRCPSSSLASPSRTSSQSPWLRSPSPPMTAGMCQWFAHTAPKATKRAWRTSKGAGFDSRAPAWTRSGLDNTELDERLPSRRATGQGGPLLAAHVGAVWRGASPIRARLEWR